MSKVSKPATIVVKNGHISGTGNNSGSSDKGHNDGRVVKKTDRHIQIRCSGRH